MDDSAYSADAMFADVYDQLKAMAARQRAQMPGSLATTELVHELYLRMGQSNDRRFGEPAQFYAYAARALRHILIDAARHQMQLKSGGNLLRLSLTDPVVDGVSIDPLQALQLDAALRALEQDDPRAAKVVELHYFAGLGLERVAEILDVNVRTVDRDWRYARAFLAARAGD
jgi:RNA polymerase sigma factor (TIGR02999 family)